MEYKEGNETKKEVDKISFSFLLYTVTSKGTRFLSTCQTTSKKKKKVGGVSESGWMLWDPSVPCCMFSTLFFTLMSLRRLVIGEKENIVCCETNCYSHPPLSLCVCVCHIFILIYEISFSSFYLPHLWTFENEKFLFWWGEKKNELLTMCDRTTRGVRVYCANA